MVVFYFKPNKEERKKKQSYLHNCTGSNYHKLNIIMPNKKDENMKEKKKTRQKKDSQRAGPMTYRKVPCSN